jgi:hypothetical protein
MGPTILALLIYECVCSMKPIKIDGVRVGGVGGYALIFTGERDKLIVWILLVCFLASSIICLWSKLNLKLKNK